MRDLITANKLTNSPQRSGVKTMNNEKEQDNPKPDYREVCVLSTSRFGRWFYDDCSQTLRHDRAPTYCLNIGDMTTSAATLDSIFQVTCKRWITAEDVGFLIEAIRAVVDPQANLCSFGRERNANAANTTTRKK